MRAPCDQPAVLSSTRPSGLAHLFDVATKRLGLVHQPNSFSTTLGRYGVAAGPYLYLPVLGPSSVRGAIGSGVDGALNPIYWPPYAQTTTVAAGSAVVGGLDLRVEADGPLKALVDDAIDPYATLRSAYLQSQQSLVDGDLIPLKSLPDYDEPASSVPPLPKPAPATGDEARTDNSELTMGRFSSRAGGRGGGNGAAGSRASAPPARLQAAATGRLGFGGRAVAA